MNKNLTLTRLVLAIVSMALEQAAIWVIWRWLLPELDINLHVSVLIMIMAAWAILGTMLFIFTTRALKKQTTIGLPSMTGSRGKVTTKLAPDGMVRIRGELWSAQSTEGTINEGEDVVIVSQDSLKLLVRRADKTALYIKEKRYYVPVLDNIFLPFQAEQAFLTRLSDAAAFYQFVQVDGLGADKAFFHIGMDFTGGFLGGGAFAEGQALTSFSPAVKKVIKSESS